MRIHANTIDATPTRFLQSCTCKRECCSSSPMGRSFCSSFLSNLLSCRVLLKETQDDYRYLTVPQKEPKPMQKARTPKGLNRGLVSTVLAQLTFLQVLPTFKLLGGVQNVPSAGGFNEVAAWAVRRLLDVWFLGSLPMQGWWRPFWRWWYASHRHSSTKKLALDTCQILRKTCSVGGERWVLIHLFRVWGGHCSGVFQLVYQVLFEVKRLRAPKVISYLKLEDFWQADGVDVGLPATPRERTESEFRSHAFVDAQHQGVALGDLMHHPAWCMTLKQGDIMSHTQFCSFGTGLVAFRQFFVWSPFNSTSDSFTTRYWPTFYHNKQEVTIYSDLCPSPAGHLIPISVEA